MEWKDWVGKRIFVQLKSGGFYSGVVEEIKEISKELVFISLIDKFGQWVTFTISEITKIVEEKDG